MSSLPTKQNYHPLDQSRRQTKTVTILSIFQLAGRSDKLLMALGTVSAIGAGLSSPLFMILFSTISEIFIPGNEENAEAQGRTLFFYLLLTGIFTWLSNTAAIWAWNKSGHNQINNLKKQYFSALLSQQIPWYDTLESSKITTEMNQNTIAIQTVMGDKISFLITSITLSVFGFIFSFVKCWKMSLYLSLYLPFMLIAGYSMIKSLGLKAQTSKVSYENAGSIAENAFRSIKTIKLLCSEKTEQNKFGKALQSVQQKLKKHIAIFSGISGFMNLTMMGIYSYGFFLGKYMMIENPGSYSASQLISTFFCFLVAGQTIGQLSPVVKNMTDAKIAYQKIHKILTRKQLVTEQNQGSEVTTISQNIEFQNVTFSYPKIIEENKEQHFEYSQQVLKKISFTLKKGTITALVGSSGSGKSTVSQLLMKFYQHSKGSIYVDGINLSQVNSSQFRKIIGYVGQQPVLFSMSIKQNIEMANPEIKTDEIEKLLQKSNALQFVNKLPKGIDTYVGSQGAQLSGGQKQRIAIARALAKKPRLIIFDEATSALDQQSERKIQKTIDKLVEEDLIVLIIAHRLSTIQKANNIIVMKDGEILDFGTHEHLLKNSQFYQNLMKDQLKSLIENQNIVDQKNQKKNKEQKKLDIKSEEIEFKQQKKQIENSRLRTYLELLKVSKEAKNFLIWGSIFASINGLVFPFFNITFSNVMGLIANAEKNNSEINQYCFAFLIISIVAAVANCSYNLLFGIFGEKLVIKLRISIFKKLVKFPCAYFDRQQNTPGAISTKISQDTFQLHSVLTGILSVLCLNFFIITASLIFAFYYSWKLTLIILIFTPLLAAKGAIQSSILKRMSKQADEIEKTLGSIMSDAISNIRTVRSLGNLDYIMDIVNEKLDSNETLSSKKFLQLGLLQGFSRSSAVLIYSVVFWVASALFAHHQFTDPRDALISIFCIIFSASTVGQNSQLMPDLKKAEKAAINILKLINTKDQFEQAKLLESNQLKKSKIKGKIQFINVDFSYPSRKGLVLSNFSLKINEGQKVCLVGSSGSGKSTLLHILSRLYPISSGQVLIDGCPLYHYNLRRFRKQLGVVSQEPLIFKGTIKQNILYSVKEEKISKAQKKLSKCCHIACLTETITKFKQGLDKQVGQKGSLISGGQKQRVALARCLLRNPALFLMDQFTSALDVTTESDLLDKMMDKIKKRTFIFTAHRLNTIKKGNLILLIKQGKIAECGNFQGLIQKKGEFYRLVYGNSLQSQS